MRHAILQALSEGAYPEDKRIDVYKNEGVAGEVFDRTGVSKTPAPPRGVVGVVGADLVRDGVGVAVADRVRSYRHPG